MEIMKDNNHKEIKNKMGIALTQEEFDQIKELLSQHLFLEKIKESIGRSEGTIIMVKKASSLEDYFRMSRETSKKYKKGYKHPHSLKQTEFDQIKQLLFEGHTLSEIQEQTKRSKFVITRVKNAQSLNDYFKIQHDYWRDHKNPSPLEQYAKEVGTVIEPPLIPPVAKEIPPHQIAFFEALDTYIAEEVAIKIKSKLEKLLTE